MFSVCGCWRGCVFLSKQRTALCFCNLSKNAICRPLAREPLLSLFMFSSRHLSLSVPLCLSQSHLTAGSAASAQLCPSRVSLSCACAQLTYIYQEPRISDRPLVSSKERSPVTSPRVRVVTGCATRVALRRLASRPHLRWCDSHSVRAPCSPPAPHRPLTR